MSYEDRKTKAASSSANWNDVRKDYIANKMGMRELSRKYGYAVSTISERAKKEGWKRTAEQVERQTEQKLIEQVAKAQASNADKAMRIISKLMDKIEESIEVIPKGDMQALKQAVASVKDLNEMGVFEVLTDSRDVEITFGKGAEDYAD